MGYSWTGRSREPQRRWLIRGQLICAAVAGALLLASVGADAAPGSYSGSVDSDGLNGSGGGNVIFLWLVAGQAIAVLLKLTALGPGKDMTWAKVVPAGLLASVAIFMAVQFAVIAAVIAAVFLPIYLVIKLFDK